MKLKTVVFSIPFLALATLGCQTTKTAGESEKPEPLQQTQLCMGSHAHVALSNSKYFDVIKLVDDAGKPIKCEVKDKEAPSKVATKTGGEGVDKPAGK